MSGDFATLKPLPFRPSGIIFDMDGLLFDSEELYREVFFELLEARGLDSAAAHFPGLVGLGWGETLDLLAQWFPECDARSFVDDWKAACRPNRGRFPRLKHGVFELLALLERERISAVIATGSQREIAHAYLCHHGLGDRFLGVVAAEDCQRGKPHPEPFLQAAKTLEAAPGDCVVLEDSPNGIRAAHAAGALAIMVPDLVAADEEMIVLSHGVAADLLVVASAIEAVA